MREQNYIQRPLDLLRLNHEKIEAWILKQAGVQFDALSETEYPTVATLHKVLHAVELRLSVTPEHV